MVRVSSRTAWIFLCGIYIGRSRRLIKSGLNMHKASFLFGPARKEELSAHKIREPAIVALCASDTLLPTPTQLYARTRHKAALFSSLLRFNRPKLAHGRDSVLISVRPSQSLIDPSAPATTRTRVAISGRDFETASISFFFLRQNVLRAFPV